jgi:hypothetical protein
MVIGCDCEFSYCRHSDVARQSDPLCGAAFAATVFFERYLPSRVIEHIQKLTQTLHAIGNSSSVRSSSGGVSAGVFW